jgi:CMP-N,N'-diacetyllegionaminic acid synthase
VSAIGRFIPAIIPARGGSQRIPFKNLARVGGHPLLAHTIVAARKATLVSEVFVSTDAEEIALVAERYGATVIERPPELAGAYAPTEPALLHALEVIEQAHGRADWVAMLQATCPLRRDFRIDQAIGLAVDESCDCVVSVTPVVDYYFTGDVDDRGRLSLGYDPKDRLRTQDIPPKYQENGAIYVMTRDLLVNEECRMGGDMRALVMDRNESIDIDDVIDLKLCNLLLARNPQLAPAQLDLEPSASPLLN